MAIFHLNHKFVGRTTHRAGYASCFARYITRPEARTEVIGERMPIHRRGLIPWLDEQEQGDRRNARVIDQVVVALPNELSREQNIELLQAFGERMTEGRASWMAAIHDGEREGNNPHAHMIFRDRDLETGKRVMLTTEKGSTQRFRDAWEEEVNLALERAGLEVRVDKRSLEDQGIDRLPQIHVGAGAEALRGKEHEFGSEPQEITRLINGVPTTVTVNYPAIDEGNTRFEENEIRKALNRARELSMEALALEEEELRWRYHREITDKLNPPLDESDVIGQLVFEHLSRDDRRRTQEARDARYTPKLVVGSGNDDTGRAPRKDPTDMVAGAGLAAIGKIADSLSSLFEGGSGSREQEMQRENPMIDPKKAQDMRNEQQQRQAEAQEAESRREWMQAWLDQRARERGIDRGRGR